MVQGHQLQRLRPDQPDAAKLAAIEQRAAEGEIVGSCRAQSAAARIEGWRRKIGALRRIVLQLHLSGRVVRIAGGKAMRLLLRHVEAGVAHAERIEDALLQELLERLVRNLADEIA